MIPTWQKNESGQNLLVELVHRTQDGHDGVTVGRSTGENMTDEQGRRKGVLDVVGRVMRSR